MRIGWDQSKNEANIARHGISFEEASALSDEGVEYLVLFDAEVSDDRTI